MELVSIFWLVQLGQIVRLSAICSVHVRMSLIVARMKDLRITCPFLVWRLMHWTKGECVLDLAFFTTKVSGRSIVASLSTFGAAAFVAAIPAVIL